MTKLLKLLSKSHIAKDLPDPEMLGKFSPVKKSKKKKKTANGPKE